ncbi:hypothetical protein [Microcystis aeruginosa]|jgi:hypothetical protein|uniref:Uncharacterized protein n=1 Tax=Microcystis aeruginosa FD4 TaxID=2686288 RepID=A0A857D7I1_MICAE|nr:hypothetical protein [Microcystis aeruginosa]QGZ91475.1 hypothetical protein GQR42_20115 [Microcystis aeruginosa FD4]
MTTLLYYILKSWFWQRIVMTSPLNLGEEGDASCVNLSLSTKNPPKQSYPLSWTKGDHRTRTILADDCQKAITNTLSHNS